MSWQRFYHLVRDLHDYPGCWRNRSLILSLDILLQVTQKIANLGLQFTLLRLLLLANRFDSLLFYPFTLYPYQSGVALPTMQSLHVKSVLSKVISSFILLLLLKHLSLCLFVFAFQFLNDGLLVQHSEVLGHQSPSSSEDEFVLPHRHILVVGFDGRHGLLGMNPSYQQPDLIQFLTQKF